MPERTLRHYTPGLIGGRTNKLDFVAVLLRPGSPISEFCVN